MIRAIRLYGTTDSSGDLSVTSITPVIGLLHAIEWVDGTFADGVDAVISVVRDGDAADVTLDTLTDANADAWYYPVIQASGTTGSPVAAEYTREIVNGRLKLVVSDGGDEASGGCIVYIEV